LMQDTNEIREFPNSLDNSNRSGHPELRPSFKRTASVGHLGSGGPGGQGAGRRFPSPLLLVSSAQRPIVRNFRVAVGILQLIVRWLALNSR